MEETRQTFLSDLVTIPLSQCASVWLFDRIPHIFKDDFRSHVNWKHQLAEGLGVDASCIIITGSAAFGVSLNPSKNYKFFDDRSDIDVAVVSEYHFNEGWRTLRNLGSRRYALNNVVAAAVQDHVNRLIYWGTIATDRILHLLPYGQDWRKALNECAKREPMLNRSINARVYKDMESLRAYHVINLKNLKNREMELK